MTAYEERSIKADLNASFFAERAEKLCINIANEEAVSSESAGLVTALEDLDLAVTEEQVVEATRAILPSTEEQFFKDAFLRLVEWLRPQLPASEASTPPSPSTEEQFSKDAFLRQVSMDILDVDVREYAEEVHAMVEQAMVSQINQAVDTDLQTYLSTMPLVSDEAREELRQGWLTMPLVSDDAREEFRQGWLKQHYVKHVAAVVKRFMKARWFFKPALTLEAAQLYSSVDEAAAVKIDTMVASDFLPVASTLSVSISPQLKDLLRIGWLQENYIKVVARVLEEEARNNAANWIFSPEVLVESLSEAERAAATKMYASVDFAAATEIDAVVENKISSVAALLPASVHPDIKAEVRSSWLLQNYALLQRARVFARINQEQLHWTIAQDRPLHRDDRDLPSEQLDAKRRRWLELHDQETAHVVSQVPLAVNMPMRLTDTVDHQRQLFRGRRCRMLGWAPHPREERFDVDGEWVLTKMPQVIYL